MKILQLSKKMPFPLRDGESVAVHSLTTAMVRQHCEYTLLVMNTPKHAVKLDELPTSYQHYTAIHAVDVDTDVKISGAFFNLFTPKSYHISRFDNQAFHDKLTALLNETHYDLVQLETLFLTPYIETIRKHSRAKIVLRAHNVEYEIWARLAAQTTFLPKKYYLTFLVKRLKAYEIEQLNRPDLIVGITARDNEHYADLGCNIPLFVSPCPINTISVNNSAEKNNKTTPKLRGETWEIGFLGSLDWLPNQEAVEWFIKAVWEKARARNPSWRLNIAGRNTPDAWQTRWQTVKVVGEVADAQAFIEANDVMIVPILSGSGMRIKIIEAMALQKVVVTTSIGAEGIDAVHERDFLLANTPDEFIACLESCFYDPEKQHQIAQHAEQFVKQHFDSAYIAQQLIARYKQLLAETA